MNNEFAGHATQREQLTGTIDGEAYQVNWENRSMLLKLKIVPFFFLL